MKASDVAVTGAGMVTPLGSTAGECARAWLGGAQAVRRRLPEFSDTCLEGEAVGLLPEFDPAERLGGRRMLKYMSEAAVLGSVAAREAVEEAGPRDRFEAERIGLFAATGLAAANPKETQALVGASIDEEGNFSTRLFAEKGLAVTSPVLSFRILANMPSCLVSIMEGVKGPNYIFSPWEGQGGAALIEGWRAVASGEVDAALAGGADSGAQPSALVFLRQSGLIGESEWPSSGAAYLLFERAESAIRDHRRVYARIVEMELVPSDLPARDPLAERLGRTFAAAPAILLALSAHVTAEASGRRVTATISGADRQEFRFVLEGP